MTTHKQKGIVYTFFMRWVICSLGLWIAAGIFSKYIGYNDKISVIFIGGALLAVFNMVIRPILVVISMPALLLSLGLFMIVVNGLVVYLVSLLYGPLTIAHFWVAIATGIVIGLVNYIVTAILEES